MKHLRKSIYYIFPILLVLPFKGIAQNIEQKDSSNNILVIAAKEIISAASTCALITTDEEGLPRVRAMDPFTPDSDFTVWFGTNSKSRKVNQIKNNPKVTLYYLDSDASGYVIIHGKAHLIDDQEEKEKRWKDKWEAFYPNNREDYLLIKVSPLWMEVSSAPRGIVGNPTTWQPPVVHFDSVE